jgi:hypothetical protein
MESESPLFLVFEHLEFTVEGSDSRGLLPRSDAFEDFPDSLGCFLTLLVDGVDLVLLIVFLAFFLGFFCFVFLEDFLIVFA